MVHIIGLTTRQPSPHDRVAAGSESLLELLPAYRRAKGLSAPSSAPLAHGQDSDGRLPAPCAGDEGVLVGSVGACHGQKA